jgi:hypothetical protein
MLVALKKDIKSVVESATLALKHCAKCWMTNCGAMNAKLIDKRQNHA